MYAVVMHFCCRGNGRIKQHGVRVGIIKHAFVSMSVQGKQQSAIRKYNVMCTFIIPGVVRCNAMNNVHAEGTMVFIVK